MRRANPAHEMNCACRTKAPAFFGHPEGERTISEVERADLYEPAGYVVDEPIDRRRLVDQLAAVVAAT